MSDLVPEGWKQHELGDCFSILKSGLSRRLSHSDIGMPVIRSGNIGEKHTIFNDVKFWYINDPQGSDTSNYILDSGDILINFINSKSQIGKTCIFRNSINRDCIYTTNILRAKPSKRVTSDFLYFLTKTDQYDIYIQSITKPAVNQASFTTKEFRNHQVLLPPLPEQQKIAKILTSVDTVIEKTEAQINKLQNLKKGMMQELLTKGIGHTEFKDSPVGRIPKGWEIVNLEKISTKITDGEHQTPKRSNDGIYLLSARNVRDGFIDVRNVDYIQTEVYEKLSKRVLPKENDILISCSGTIGRTALVPKDFYFSIVRSVAIVQPKHNVVDATFLAHQIASPLVQEQIKKSLSQLAQANLFQAPIKALKVVMPKMLEQKKIGQIVTAVDKKINNASSLLKKQQSLKKALMQDLLTGKVRVKVN
jgi:type I restriction enzyme, S subunit